MHRSNKTILQSRTVLFLVFSQTCSLFKNKRTTAVVFAYDFIQKNDFSLFSPFAQKLTSNNSAVSDFSDYGAMEWTEKCQKYLQHVFQFFYQPVPMLQDRRIYKTILDRDPRTLLPFHYWAQELVDTRMVVMREQRYLVPHRDFSAKSKVMRCMIHSACGKRGRNRPWEHLDKGDSLSGNIIKLSEMCLLCYFLTVKCDDSAKVRPLREKWGAEIKSFWASQDALLLLMKRSTTCIDRRMTRYKTIRIGHKS